MKLTVVNRTVLGFGVVLILMTLIASVGFMSQRHSNSVYSHVSESLIPIVQNSNRLAIYALDAIKVVSQHAVSIDAVKRSQLESDFASTVASYEQSKKSLSGLVADNPQLNSALAQANEEITKAFDIARLQIEDRNKYMQLDETFRSATQNYAARWVTFNSERDTAIQLAGRLDLVGSFAVSTIAHDLTLAQTTLAGVSNIDDLSKLIAIKSQLDKQSSLVISRMTKLEALAPEASGKLKPFSDFLQFSVASSQGYLPLQVEKVKLEEKVRSNLQGMGRQLTLAQAYLNKLNRTINETIDVQNQQVTQSANQTLMLTSVLFLGAIITSLLIVVGQIRSIRSPLKVITTTLKKLSSGDLTSKVTVESNDEFGTIGDGINQLSHKLSVLLSQIQENSSVLAKSMERAEASTLKSESMLSDQRRETDSVATAISEMDSAAAEVARNAESSLAEILVIKEQSSVGRNQMTTSIHTIEQLDGDIKHAVTTIEQMKQESENISSILEVITGIAEQTNLLALNAAIEAARAGEQGRGFAVVADEVRNLASKTQNSTEEIKRMIESLQSTSTLSVDLMEQNSSTAKKVVSDSSDAAASLEVITAGITSMAAVSEQIASAALEQSQVAQEITHNIVRISDSSQEVLDLSRGNRETFEQLNLLSNEQQQVTERFKI